MSLIKKGPKCLHYKKHGHRRRECNKFKAWLIKKGILWRWTTERERILQVVDGCEVKVEAVVEKKRGTKRTVWHRKAISRRTAQLPEVV
jgi:hypothetical protein